MAINTDSIPTGKYIAFIREQDCIGCTLCIKACPFDAIIGASKQIHTVIKFYCTGCKLCLPPCPVDCINLNPNSEFQEACKTLSDDQQSEIKRSFAKLSRENKQRRDQRLAKEKMTKQLAFERKKNKLLNR